MNPYQKKHQIGTMKDHARYCTGRQDATRLEFVIYQLERMFQATGDKYIPEGMTAETIVERALMPPRGKQIEAFINNNRWIARCECGGCEVVDPNDPIFYCLNPLCLNAENKYRARKVKLPKKMEDIEGILLRRKPENRHWYTHESVDRLRKQNKAHGLD